MNLKQLEAFQAIMATGSTMAAAARMSTSQSAVSRLLTQLEQTLGFPVFFRNKGRLIATPEGEAFLLEANGLIEHNQRVQRVADDLRLGRSQKTLLKVAVPTTITYQSIPFIISEFLKDRDNTVIELITGPSDMLERAVFNRSADFALVSLPPELNCFEIIPVFATQRICIIPQAHPLSQKEWISARDLVSEPMILTGRNSASRVEIDTWFSNSKIEPLVRVEVHSVSTACALVAKGVGISIASGLLAREFSGWPIELRPIKPSIQCAYGLIFRNDVPKSRATQEFAEYIKKWLSTDQQILPI